LNVSSSLRRNVFVVEADKRQAQRQAQRQGRKLGLKREQLSHYAKYVGNGYTSLHFAVVNNSPELLKVALQYAEFRDPLVLDALSTSGTTGLVGPILDADDVMHQTALHKAVIYGHLKCVQVLLHFEACPNKCLALDRSQSLPPAKRAGGPLRTPLHAAVSNNDVVCTKLLLDNGATPNLAKNAKALNACRDLVLSKQKKKLRPKPPPRQNSAPVLLKGGTNDPSRADDDDDDGGEEEEEESARPASENSKKTNKKSPFFRGAATFLLKTRTSTTTTTTTTTKKPPPRASAKHKQPIG